MTDSLNIKQQRFCEEYIIDFNGTQAAIRAGYSEKTSYSISSENLKKPEIQQYIATLISKVSKKTEITAERVAAEFAKIAFSSIAHLHNSWIDLKDFESLTEDQKASIESIKTRRKEITGHDGSTGIYDVEVFIKLYDKQKALENLGKYTGEFYEKDNEQKSNINHHTDDELIDKLAGFVKAISKAKD